MAATKSALTSGMHHCFFRHGLIVFFQVQPHCLVRQGLNHTQFHYPVRQQLQSPVAVALGSQTAGQGNQVGLGPVIHLAVPVSLRPVSQHPVQPALGEAPLDVEYRALGHVQGLGHPGPVEGPALIGLEQDAGPVDNPGGTPSHPDHVLQLVALLRHQPDREFLPDNNTYCLHISTDTRSLATTSTPSLIEY